MSIKRMAWAGVAGMALILAACAGGGSGDAPPAAALSPPPPPPPPPPTPQSVAGPPTAVTDFTSWANVSNPSNTRLVGLELSSKMSQGGRANDLIYGNWTAPVPGPTSLTIARYGNGALYSIETTIAGEATGSVRFGVGPDRPSACCLVDFHGMPAAVTVYNDVSDPFTGAYASGLPSTQNYQTYGFWWIDGTSSNGSAVLSGFSVGAATPAANIPSSGAAQFRGGLLAKGLIGGQESLIAANVSLDVDFAGQRAVFASSDWSTPTQFMPDTALSGLLTYAPGGNALSGTLTTANGQFSGPATGQFYGPAAEEVGGAFYLTSGANGQDRVAGGFGAKR